MPLVFAGNFIATSSIALSIWAAVITAVVGVTKELVSPIFNVAFMPLAA